MGGPGEARIGSEEGAEPEDAAGRFEPCGLRLRATKSAETVPGRADMKGGGVRTGKTRRAQKRRRAGVSGRSPAEGMRGPHLSGKAGRGADLRSVGSGAGRCGGGASSAELLQAQGGGGNVLPVRARAVVIFRLEFFSVYERMRVKKDNERKRKTSAVDFGDGCRICRVRSPDKRYYARR